MGRLDQQIAALVENNQVSKEEIGAIYEEPRNSLSGSISSADTKSYADIGDAIRELPPIPFDSLANHYADPDNTATEMTSGMISKEPQIDSGISPDVDPPSKVEAPYSGLESSTREPPPAPVAYENLVKPVYVNTNNTDLTNDEPSDEPQCDSGISLNTCRPSSDMETSV